MSIELLRPRKGINDLASIYPDVAAEFDYSRNIGITPDDICYASDIQLWWICKQGHSYRSALNDRTCHGKGCPYCSGRIPIRGINDFATLHPDLAEEWHPTKNGKLTPDMITECSGRKIWWLGKCGHEWVATPDKRVCVGTGCPECKKYMSTSFPEKAIYYYLTKLFPDAVQNVSGLLEPNKRMELDIYIPSINTAIEYDGQAWHKDPDKDLRKDQACMRAGIKLYRIREPKCAIYDSEHTTFIVRRSATGYESLNKAIVKLLEYLDVKDMIIVNTRYDATDILNLIPLPEVAGSVASLYTSAIDDWHPTKNGNLTPGMFTPNSNVSVWWIDDNEHAYQQKISVYCRAHKEFRVKPDTLPNVS